MTRMTISIGAAILWCGLAAGPAAAQTTDTAVADAITWGFTTMELATGGAMLYTFTRGEPLPAWQHVTLASVPMVLGVGAGFLAHQGGWNGAAGRAVHGSLWGGFAGYMLGSVIDGAGEVEALERGPWTYALTAVGVGAAAWLGATQVDPATETPLWLGIPGGVAAGSLAVGGGIAVAMAYGGARRRGIQVLAVLTSTAVVGGLLLGSLVNPSPDGGSPAPATPVMITIGL